jgi:hypothetical protein
VSERSKILLAGGVTIAMGLFAVLSAFDVIAADSSDFGAPRWFVAAFGQLFVLVGVWLVISRAPDGPLAGLLRVLMAPLLLALGALFCVLVVAWPGRVGAGSEARVLFFVLGGVFALFAGRALLRVAARTGRLARR